MHETIGGPGADLVLNSAAEPECVNTGVGIAQLGGTVIATGQAGMAAVFGPRIRAGELTVLGSRGHLPSDIPLTMRMLRRDCERYPFHRMHTLFPFAEAGVTPASAAVRNGQTPRALGDAGRAYG